MKQWGNIKTIWTKLKNYHSSTSTLITVTGLKCYGSNMQYTLETSAGGKAMLQRIYDQVGR